MCWVLQITRLQPSTDTMRSIWLNSATASNLQLGYVYKSKGLTSAVQCGVPAAVSFVAKCNMVQHLQQCSAPPSGFRPHRTQEAKYLFVLDLRVILFFLKLLDLILNSCKIFDDTATTSVTVTCHVSRVSVRLSRVSPDPYHPLPIPAWLPGLLPISSNTRSRVEMCHCVTRPQAASYTRLWIGIFII